MLGSLLSAIGGAVSGIGKGIGGLLGLGGGKKGGGGGMNFGANVGPKFNGAGMMQNMGRPPATMIDPSKYMSFGPPNNLARTTAQWPSMAANPMAAVQQRPTQVAPQMQMPSQNLQTSALMNRQFTGLAKNPFSFGQGHPFNQFFSHLNQEGMAFPGRGASPAEYQSYLEGNPGPLQYRKQFEEGLKMKGEMQQPGADIQNILKKNSGASPSYMDLAKSFLGQNEIKDNKAIAAFLQKSLGENIDPSSTAWCSYFLNGILKSSGLKGTGSGMAKSFLNYGTEVDTPTEGDIAVFHRGKDPRFGHVGIYAGETMRNGQRYIKVLGGNQNNSVSIAEYPASNLAGIRRPPAAQEAAANAPTANPYEPVFQRAATKTGANPEFLQRMADIETGGTYSNNLKSSTGAKGMFQFTGGTWRNMVKRYGPQYGVTFDQIADPEASATLAGAYAKENGSYLEKQLGRPLQDYELYIAHNLGAVGAKKLLTADPNKPIGSWIGSNPKHNPKFFYKNGRPVTAGEAIQRYAEFF